MGKGTVNQFSQKLSLLHPCHVETAFPIHFQLEAGRFFNNKVAISYERD